MPFAHASQLHCVSALANVARCISVWHLLARSCCRSIHITVAPVRCAVQEVPAAFEPVAPPPPVHVYEVTVMTSDIR